MADLTNSELSGEASASSAGTGPGGEHRFQKQRQVDFIAAQLMSEKELVDPSLITVHQALQEAIDRRTFKMEPEYLEIDIPKKIKLSKKLLIPVLRNPEFNFVGKLMGPGGSTMKKLQEKFACKIYVLGRGSSKDLFNEQKLLQSGDPKYTHYAEDLHIKVDVIGVPAEAYRKMADVIDELKGYLTANPDDEISQKQIAELGFNPHETGKAKVALYAAVAQRAAAARTFRPRASMGPPRGQFARPPRNPAPTSYGAFGANGSTPGDEYGGGYGRNGDIGADPNAGSCGHQGYNMAPPNSTGAPPRPGGPGGYGRVFSGPPMGYPPAGGPPNSGHFAPMTAGGEPGVPGKFPPPSQNRGTFRAHPYGPGPGADMRAPF